MNVNIFTIGFDTKNENAQLVACCFTLCILGLQWSNVWKPVTPDDTLTIGHIMIMLIVDSIIYLFVALYVEAVFPGEYGIPQVWYFPFTVSYWTGQPRYVGNVYKILKYCLLLKRFFFVGTESYEDKSHEKSDFFEKEPGNLRAGIKILNLRKVFKKKTAVRDVTLNMYENHITVLLGKYLHYIFM